MLGYFNNWNIIIFSHKTTSSEYIDNINHVVLDGISENMYVLVQKVNYEAINTIDTTTVG